MQSTEWAEQPWFLATGNVELPPTRLRGFPLPSDSWRRTDGVELRGASVVSGEHLENGW
ncbi:hypothetical protein [Luethyella okanaganae]|uniref:Uncharacterized protein n=1 Tax=Luethyella okanaganae TaxID=69372 RepID=A0ABW1VF52_9MICO